MHDKTTCPLCVWRSKWEESVRSSGWQPVPEGEEACKAAMEPLDKLLLSHPHNTGALSKDEIAWHNDEFVRQHSVFARLIWGEFDEEKDGSTEPR